jgi:4-amino-4-deoxy-L-arabinose transferase-like glycosyltransferase
MEFLKKNIFLILIILLAALFRFWGITSTPPSMYWDEVSQGYNAYSILQTGFDEHHKFLPITHFEAFGDDKAPVYIYLDVASIALFGKTDFAVRFPSAFFGTLTILLAYGLVFELFYNHKKRNALALICSFLLAISPWHIQLSRIAYEGNIATFFGLLGIYLFFFAKRRQMWLFILSVISFVLSFYAFNAHRVFIPLLVIFFFVLFWKDLFKRTNLLAVGTGCIIGIALLVPFIFYLQNPVSRVRFQEVNIFSDSSAVQQSNRWQAEEGHTKIADVLDNRRILFAFSYLQHYFDFFNPQFLFGSGDVNPRFSDQDTGELFWFELPLILVGIYELIKQKNKTTLALLGWFILAPMAAATARETPHALRAETYIPLYEIFAGLGILSIYMFIKKSFVKKIFVSTFTIWVFISVIFFLHSYFIHLGTFYSYDFQYGYKQAVAEAQKLEKNYDVISFSNIYGRAYIYYLFYGNISPQIYWQQKNETRDAFGLYNVWGVGKYRFGPSFVEPGDGNKKVLYIGNLQEIPSGTHIIKTIHFLNGNPAFVIATNTN